MALSVGMPWPEEYYPNKVVCGVKLDKPDTFHEMILVDEFSRCGNTAINSSICGGNTIGIHHI